MDIDIYVAVIGVLAAYLTGTRNTKNQFVLKDREEWRNYLRSWVAMLSALSVNDKDLLLVRRNELSVRVNPKLDKDLIDLLDKMLETSSKVEFDNYRKVVIMYVSKVLKGEWERVKDDSTLLGFKTFYDVVAVLIILISLICELSKNRLTDLDITLFPVTLSLLFTYVVTKTFSKLVINGTGLKKKIYPNFYMSIEVVRKKLGICVINFSKKSHVQHIFDENQKYSEKELKRKHIQRLNSIISGIVLILIVSFTGLFSIKGVFKLFLIFYSLFYNIHVDQSLLEYFNI